MASLREPIEHDWRFGPARKRTKILSTRGSKTSRDDRGSHRPCAPTGRDSNTLLSPPPKTRFRQVVHLVYHYDCAISGPGATFSPCPVSRSPLCAVSSLRCCSTCI